MKCKRCGEFDHDSTFLTFDRILYCCYNCGARWVDNPDDYSVPKILRWKDIKTSRPRPGPVDYYVAYCDPGVMEYYGIAKVRADGFTTLNENGMIIERGYWRPMEPLPKDGDESD